MRRFLSRSALGLLVVSATVLAEGWVAPYTYRYEMATCPTGSSAGKCLAAQACAAGTCNGTVPTGAGEGMELYAVVSYRLTVCAASGQSLSGAGTLQAYRYDTSEGLWVRNLGLDQSVTASGVQCQVFPDFLLAGGQLGRVRFVASGVTVSGGSGLDVLLDGYAVQN